MAKFLKRKTTQIWQCELLSFQRVLLSASPPRYRGRCWAAIRLSHRPEPSGRVVRGGIDGLDSGTQHGRRFVLSHTHSPQRRPYPYCTGRSGNVRHRWGGGWAGPRLFLGGSFRVCVYRCLELKCGVLWGCPPTPCSIDDTPTAPHVCCCQKNWSVVVRRVQMGVSIWGAVQLHPMDGWALNGAGVQAPWHRDSVRPRDSVATLQRSSACWMPAGIGRLSAGVDAGIQSQFARRRWWWGQ